MNRLTVANTASELILWGVSVSPYVRKVIVVLNEKNIPFMQMEMSGFEFSDNKWSHLVQYLARIKARDSFATITS